MALIQGAGNDLDDLLSFISFEVFFLAVLESHDLSLGWFAWEFCSKWYDIEDIIATHSVAKKDRPSLLSSVLLLPVCRLYIIRKDSTQ